MVRHKQKTIFNAFYKLLKTLTKLQSRDLGLLLRKTTTWIENTIFIFNSNCRIYC